MTSTFRLSSVAVNEERSERILRRCKTESERVSYHICSLRLVEAFDELGLFGPRGPLSSWKIVVGKESEVVAIVTYLFW